jgi:hypothetical protein
MKPSNVPIHTVTVLTKVLLVTDGTATPRMQDVDVGIAEDWGPYIASITAYALTEEHSTNFRWRVVFYAGYDGRQYNSAVQIGSDMGAAASPNFQVHSAYSTVSSFGLKMRFAVGCYTNGGGGGIDRGIVSLTLVIQFKS